MMNFMYDFAADARDRELADQLIAAAGEMKGVAAKTIPQFYRAGEWAQAGIEALCLAYEQGRPMPQSLVKEALSRWLEDMGQDTAELIVQIPDRELVPA